MPEADNGQHREQLSLGFINKPPAPDSAKARATIFVKDEAVRMDSIVAQYSRPLYEDEGYSSEEQMELTQATPNISLKFAMPPIAQVSTTHGTCQP